MGSRGGGGGAGRLRSTVIFGSTTEALAKHMPRHFCNVNHVAELSSPPSLSFQGVITLLRPSPAMVPDFGKPDKGWLVCDDPAACGVMLINQDPREHNPSSYPRLQNGNPWAKSHLGMI